MASGSTLVPAAERERFEQDGYLIITGALTHDEVLYYREALDRAYLSAEAESLVAPGGSLHWLSAVARCPQVVRDLIAAITLNRERGSPELGVRPDRRALGQPVTPIWGRASSHFETYTRVLTESNTYDFEITTVPRAEIP